LWLQAKHKAEEVKRVALEAERKAVMEAKTKASAEDEKRAAAGTERRAEKDATESSKTASSLLNTETQESGMGFLFSLLVIFRMSFQCQFLLSIRFSTLEIPHSLQTAPSRLIAAFWLSLHSPTPSLNLLWIFLMCLVAYATHMYLRLSVTSLTKGLNLEYLLATTQSLKLIKIFNLKVEKFW